MIGGTEAWQSTNGFFVEEGRFFSVIDIEHNSGVCVLGLDIVEKLFTFEDAVDKEVLIDGRR
ncbi:MAG: ABC transporter permease, partial [bacterium]